MTETKTKKAPNPILRLGLILFLVTAITAGILGYVNYLTKDTIAMRKAQATAEAYSEVLPVGEGETYDEIDFDQTAYPTVDKISKASGGEGYVVELSFSGAQSTITAAVGIDSTGTVTGVSIISSAETSGLGAKASEPAFRDQYKGAAEHVALTKNGGEINGISGATITSTAVTNAVNTAMDAVASVQG